MTFSIKQGDTRPKYVVALKDNFGQPGEAPIDLTTATSVKMKMRKTGTTGAPKINATCALTTPAQGVVTYTWATGDTDTPATYDVEFEITWADTGIETVPNGSGADYLTVDVIDDLDTP